MKLTEEVQTRAEELQDESHEFIRNFTEGYPEMVSIIDHDSFIAVWTFQKLAELDIRIKQLELEHGIQ